MAKIDPKLVLEGNTPRLIDEWQEVPELWDAVRFEVDQRGKKGQFILTGSATPAQKGILHSGAGRISTLRENILFTNKIGYIPQNTYIFNDTLANNVLLGREISHEILLDIFSYVGLNSYLKKINYDLNYMLNIDSIGLSEGEKKRLAIARALITNPNILLIDEFDSNLDDKSMNFLVDKLSSQYSFIMVTHNNMLKNQFNNIDLNAIAIVE